MFVCVCAVREYVYFYGYIMRFMCMHRRRSSCFCIRLLQRSIGILGSDMKEVSDHSW